MRILHVIEVVSPSYGGPVSVLRDLVVGEHALGMQVEIATTNGDHPSGVYCPEGTNRRWVEVDVPVHLHRVGVNPVRYSRSFQTWIDENLPRFDLLYVHGIYRFPQTYAAWRARRIGIPYIIRAQGALDPYLYKQSSKSVILKRIYELLFEFPNLRGASAIHYMSEDEKSRASYLNVDVPSFVIPNGLRWNRFANLPSRGAFRSRLAIGNSPLVLFLGRIDFKKGLDILIPAFSEVRRKVPGVILAIVGPDSNGYKAKMMAMVREYELQNCVRFVDSLSGADVIQAYVDSDVFVLPSYTENFGMAVVEAAACGTPVVISDQVNIHADIADAGAGLVTQCDVDEVAKAVALLLADPARRVVHGHAGRALVQRKWVWDVVARQLINEYEDVVERHKRQYRGGAI